jgi:hypothetical protein
LPLLSTSTQPRTPEHLGKASKTDKGQNKQKNPSEGNKDIYKEKRFLKVSLTVPEKQNRVSPQTKKT